MDCIVETSETTLDKTQMTAKKKKAESIWEIKHGYTESCVYFGWTLQPCHPYNLTYSLIEKAVWWML